MPNDASAPETRRVSPPLRPNSRHHLDGARARRRYRVDGPMSPTQRAAKGVSPEIRAKLEIAGSDDSSLDLRPWRTAEVAGPLSYDLEMRGPEEHQKGPTMADPDTDEGAQLAGFILFVYARVCGMLVL